MAIREKVIHGEGNGAYSIKYVKRNFDYKWGQGVTVAQQRNDIPIAILSLVF